MKRILAILMVVVALALPALARPLAFDAAEKGVITVAYSSRKGIITIAYSKYVRYGIELFFIVKR